MIMAFLRAFIGTPSTSMLTCSSLMTGSGRDGRGCDDAVAVLDVVLELVPEMADETLHRPRCRIAERTDRVPFDLVRHVDQHVDVGLATLPRQDAQQRAIQPAR